MFRFPLITAVLLMLSLAYFSAASVFQLKRVHPGPSNHTVGMDVHLARDSARHARLLRNSGRGVDGAVHFGVWGTANLYLAGLYYTRVRLGTPPREYTVQIDTGSDLLWVNCISCTTCPRASQLVDELNFFDTASSTTAHLILCSDPLCPTSSHCSHECGYTVSYGDGNTRTSGSYVSDLLYLDAILGNSTTIDSSAASVLFGCSTNQVGQLTEIDVALDGIFGFGHQRLSVVSQLAFRGVTPWVFSHCLRGADSGGGILVLGEILDPSIVYTPLLPTQPNYDATLESISVKGNLLPIDQAVFTNSYGGGATIDSGTTLAYLPKEAFDLFVSAINAAVSPSVKRVTFSGGPCYMVSARVNGLFPRVSLDFAGGASMVLRPQEYLIPSNLPGMWCIGFRISEEGLTILGDLVLKDKIVVYDIARRRIGWANYDCSLPINVSVTLRPHEQFSFSISANRFLFEALVLQCILCILVDVLLMR